MNLTLPVIPKAGSSIVPSRTCVDSLAQASLPPLALAHFATNSSTLGKASSFAAAFGGGAP